MGWSRRRLEQGDQRRASATFCRRSERVEAGKMEEGMDVRNISTEMPKFLQISLTNSQ